MFIPKEILTWGKKELKEFLKKPIEIENRNYDFKLTYRVEARDIRKDFSAFANYKGGFIFFGIDDRKNICGLPEDDQISTYLNRALENHLLQPRIINWNLIHTILVKARGPKKHVYIYYIPPSLFKDRPHVSDGNIYIRQNGESKSVTSGTEIRSLFFTSNFYPEHIDQLEHELENIRDYKYKRNALNTIYFQYLGTYLHDLSLSAMEDAKQKADILFDIYLVMIRLMDEVDLAQKNAVLGSPTRIPPLFDPPDLHTKYNELKEIVSEFITKFKGFHNI